MSRGESMMAELIKGMHDLAIDLGNHNDFADKLLLKNNSITEKLVVMKEYNQAINAVDACQAPGNRAKLVAGLQQESRQVQALKEEKRLLEHSISEMLQVFNVVMDQHRRFVEDCRRSNEMLKLLDKMRTTPASHEDSKVIKMANLTKEVIEKASEDSCRYKEIIAQLVKENTTLRSLLNLPTYPSHISQLGQEVLASTADKDPSVYNPSQLSDMSYNSSTGSEVSKKVNEKESSKAVIPSVLVQQPESRKKDILKPRNTPANKVFPSSSLSQPLQYSSFSEEVSNPVEGSFQRINEDELRTRPVSSPPPAPPELSNASSITSRSKISQDEDIHGTVESDPPNTNSDRLGNIYENEDIVNQTKKGRRELLV